MKAIGICIGSTIITRVDIEKAGNNILVLNFYSKVHEGNIRKTFESMVCDDDIRLFEKVAVTGRKFKHTVNLTSISEPEATEASYHFLKSRYGHAEYISSAGGETFTTYQLDPTGKVIDIFTGNKCASGTGEFFLQQIKRMGISLENTATVSDFDNIYRVSGRCSVFCKSDCTHALNKGRDKDSIIVGLCDMMAQKIIEHLGENVGKNVWLVGGCSKNNIMVHFLKKRIPNIVIPDEAAYFEALGCALWALNNETTKVNSIDELFSPEEKSFSILRSLLIFKSRVAFKSTEKAKAEPGEKCILGLDVGSTTTKAVVIREKDNTILASVYINTLGDPINASKKCYASIKEELGCSVNVIGLGVTGSGRQIAGLHALTDGVYNEISAHAYASVYFDSDVDTIFEIGGQDAKYTHILNGVPCDYAMNDACAAGTGSFLEESAKGFLNIDVFNIERVALTGMVPPDFNDQCAAFIGSDIKTAMQENIDINNITAGLAYSICKNYLNRVKGNRYVGKKIFMQGGVCYNKAVPIAMAALLDRDIIVPPEPGLMGAFGIALMIKEKIKKGVIEERCYDLDSLINREATYDKPFVCAGGNVKCDKKCIISVINIEGNKYPFGGICGKYSTIRSNSHNIIAKNYARIREDMVFNGFHTEADNKPGKKTIGFNRSLMMNSLYPLFYNFFIKLGFDVVIPDKFQSKLDNVIKKDSAFCHPVNLAHDYFKELLKLKSDYIFLPHIKGMYVENGIPVSLTCPLVQGESYYLRASFSETDGKNIIAPIFDFAKGYEKSYRAFVETGVKMGCSVERSIDAFNHAVNMHKEFLSECKRIGMKFLEEIKNTAEKAVVIFGRPYNAFVSDANMGIPEKFSSRGYKAVPFDFLPFENEEPQKKMYWSAGQLILKAAKFVSKHPQLFGVFITNFSCGPDSFIVGYFRDIMGNKPSLTLELDSHTADAGVDTRIDAFIDVMNNYSPEEIGMCGRFTVSSHDVIQNDMAVYDYKKKKVRTVSGEYYSLTDPKVKMLVPSMGHITSRCFSAALDSVGIRSVALDPPGEDELRLGKANSSCKECLPLTLTVGSLLKYLNNHNTVDEALVYFMPDAPDPCRFGQYHVYTENLMRKLGIKNVALLSLSSGNSYGGLSTKFKLRGWYSFVIGDVLGEIHSALLTLAKDREKAVAGFNALVKKIIQSIRTDSLSRLERNLHEAALELKEIELSGSIHNARKVSVVGEIYVRRDSFSRQYIVEKLAEKGIISKVAHTSEWVYYCDYLVLNNLSEVANIKDKLNVFFERLIRKKIEKRIKKIFAESGLFEYHLIEVDKVIKNAEKLISPRLSGEAILTIGTAITELVDHVDGVVAIGPFGCMPSRIAEAILSRRMSKHKAETGLNGLVEEVVKEYPNLPFLNIETDGNIFPMQIEIKLEAFTLQVKRVNELINRLRERKIDIPV